MINLMVQRYTTTFLLLTAVLGVCSYGPVMAQTIDNEHTITSLPSNDWSFWPTDDNKAPDSTVSGASRGQCSNEDITALLPNSRYGMTSKARPEVLVAASVDMPSRALFSLQSTNDQLPNDYYYETYIELPDTPGIVSISLPQDAPALMTNEIYQWSLILMCNGQLRPDSPTVQGLIETQSTINNVEVTDSTLEQAIEYREAYLWYDMIALLADLRTQDPVDPNVEQAWHSILRSTNLTTIANEPILR